MAAGQRRALVIGNNDYRSLSRLSNAVNDAHGVSGAIRHLDFHVSYHTNLEHDELRDVAEDFVHSIRQGDTVFFYFAGHGLQEENTNYLVGIDAPKMTRDNYQKYCFSAQNLLEEIGQRLPSTIIFILDCCRDNPFIEYANPTNRHGRSSGFKHGLAKMKLQMHTYRNVNRRPATRIIIGFACAAGTVASDESSCGDNGLFACHLITQIRRRTDLVRILHAVRVAVANDSRNRQVPYIDDNGEEPLHLSNCEKDGSCERDESSSRPATSFAQVIQQLTYFFIIAQNDSK